MVKKPARKPARTRKKAPARTAHSRAAARASAVAASRQAQSKLAKDRKPPGPAPVTARATLKVTRAAAADKAVVKTKLRSKPVRGPAHRVAVEPLPDAFAEAKLEPRLTADDVEQFRLMLLDKRAEILGDVSTLNNEALNKNRREASGDLSSMPIHMADLGTDNYELEFTLGLIEGERAILKEIDEALERVRNGTYGICLATGRPIGKARLRAKPWAKYCYEYTLAQEKGQQRRF